MGRVVGAIASERNVLDAWNAVSADDTDAAATRTQELDAFRDGLLENLAGVSRDLAAGRWCPGPTRRVTLPKKDGGQRVLSVPGIRDRVAERAIYQVLGPVIDPHLHADSYGCRPGRSADDAVDAVRAQLDDGAQWIVRIDVADCFDSVRQADAIQAVNAHVTEERLARMITAVFSRTVGDKPGVGIAQGSSLSPLAANLVLDAVDRELWCRGVAPVRFLDDLCVTARDPTEAAAALRIVTSVLSSWGMAVNAAKAGVYGPTEEVGFLGRNVRGPRRAPRCAAPRRTTLYLDHRGASLRTRGSYFVMDAPGRERVRHPAARTRMIVCGPRTLLTSAVLVLARDCGTAVVVVDARRDVVGFLAGDEKHGRVIAAQHQAVGSGKALDFARTVVVGKLANCRTLLSRTKRRRALVSADTAESLGSLIDRTRNADSVAEIMGCEGGAARIYFDAWRQLVPTGWRFRGRNRQPPRDPVNAMLSYGYTILTSEVRRAIELAGLDPYCGFLHSNGRRRPSLVCDLMEEFRPLIVDTTVLRMIATSAISSDDFSTDAQRCVMDKRARVALIDHLETRLLTEVAHPVTRRRISYRECFEEQARLLARSLVTDDLRYSTFPWR